MKKLFLFVSILLITAQSNSQVRYTDQLLDNTIYSNAPDEVRNRKPFIREWMFFEERAYPNGFIPADAYKNSLDQKRLMENDNSNSTMAVTWVSLGPTPGSYPGYGSISSRIVTGAYHPTDPNIIYIGPANGGVWKTTDGGTNWQPLGDNEVSMSMGAIAIDPVNPNIVYAGTGEATYSGASYYGRGLLKSTNAGTSWINITSGLPSSSYFSRLVLRPGNPSELLAALGSSGLYRSTNAGVTWTQLSGGRCDDVVFTPNGDTAFAVGSGTGIVRSINGGASFSAFGSSGLPSGTRTHFDLCASSSSVMYAAVYTSSTFTAHKSTNSGLNWTQVSASYNFDGGQAWYDMYLRVNPVNPNQVFIGTIDIHRSTDGGSSFTNITNGYSGGNVHVDQHFMFFHPSNSNTIIATNDGGIYRSTNSGTSFVNLNQNLTLTQFYRITASPFTPSRILGGTQDNGTQQTFSTINWAAAFGGDGGEVAFNPFDANFIIGETQNGGLRRTTNGGTSWVSGTSGITTSESVAWVAPIVAHPTTSGTFYTARQRVYRSTNNGGSWTAVSGNVNGSSAVREMHISNSDPNILCASSSSQVFRSTDGGATFVNVSTGLPSKTVSSVYIHPDSANVMLVTFLGFGGAKVYKTTNGGTSWFSVAGNLPDTPISDVFIYTEDAGNPSTYFVATDIGVFVTRNEGQTWVDLDDQLPNTVIKHLDYSPSTHTLRAGTHGRGVYEAYIDFYLPVELASFTVIAGEDKVVLNWSTSTEKNNKGFEIQRKFKNQDWKTIGNVDGNGTTTSPVSYSFTDNFLFTNYEGKVLYRLKQIDFDGSYEFSSTVFADVNFGEKGFVLYQNYPNPFNPVTNIRYSIPNESKVSLKIFNAIGQVVDELVNGIQDKGYKQITWNAENFSSGIYFISLEVVDGTTQQQYHEMRKVTLMK
ncbi:MAG: T9SS type A sorting domain-containing protein [Ignavibacteriales bacterium]|nr:MAG: T9SS type A sorting domain-containing protein [Ignavibacteriales bacterium]